jgi:hypothetical protein
MRIDTASLSFQASHTSMIRDASQETLRQWRGDKRPDFEHATRSISASANTSVSLSQAARALLSIETAKASSPVATPASNELQAISDSTDATNNDPMLSLLRSMIEMMTGQAVKVFSANELSRNTPPPPSISQRQSPNGHEKAPPANATNPRAGYGIEYDAHTVHEEIETTQFSAQGIVRTEDGQEISFNLELSMTRQFREETTVSLRAGDAVRKDPLVLNFNGNAAQLLDQRFRFDLNGDGQLLNLPLLASGSGYLALDRDHNGRIDHGRELFGPATNSGFGELAALDSDGNGWIDENDGAFSQLKIWTPTGTSQGAQGTLASLADSDVGAIAVSRLQTPFELRGNANSNLGAIAASGVFLTADGRVGSVQEIDLTI